jgi:hypothetical protein
MSVSSIPRRVAYPRVSYLNLKLPNQLLLGCLAVVLGSAVDQVVGRTLGVVVSGINLGTSLPSNVSQDIGNRLSTELRDRSLLVLQERNNNLLSLSGGNGRSPVALLDSGSEVGGRSSTPGSSGGGSSGSTSESRESVLRGNIQVGSLLLGVLSIDGGGGGSSSFSLSLEKLSRSKFPHGSGFNGRGHGGAILLRKGSAGDVGHLGQYVKVKTGRYRQPDSPGSEMWRIRLDVTEHDVGGSDALRELYRGTMDSVAADSCGEARVGGLS